MGDPTINPGWAGGLKFEGSARLQIQPGGPPGRFAFSLLRPLQHGRISRLHSPAPAPRAPPPRGGLPAARAWGPPAVFLPASWNRHRIPARCRQGPYAAKAPGLRPSGPRRRPRSTTVPEPPERSPGHAAIQPVKPIRRRPGFFSGPAQAQRPAASRGEQGCRPSHRG